MQKILNPLSLILFLLLTFFRRSVIVPYLAKDPDIITMVKDTPTRFKITVDSVKNLEAAAKEVVGTVKNDILRNYEGK